MLGKTTKPGSKPAPRLGGLRLHALWVRVPGRKRTGGHRRKANQKSFRNNNNNNTNTNTTTSTTSTSTSSNNNKKKKKKKNKKRKRKKKKTKNNKNNTMPSYTLVLIHYSIVSIQLNLLGHYKENKQRTKTYSTTFISSTSMCRWICFRVHARCQKM